MNKSTPKRSSAFKVDPKLVEGAGMLLLLKYAMIINEERSKTLFSLPENLSDFFEDVGY